MTLSEFQNLVLKKGDDLSAWSESQQQEARALLDTSSEAADILTESARLRAALRSQNHVKAPAGLKDRIFLAAFASPAKRRPSHSGARRAHRGIEKAASLI